MKNIHKIIFSIPKTLYFNFRYLRLKDAIKLPIWISSNVRIHKFNGKITINGNIETAMIRIGYHEIPIMDRHSSHTIINIENNGNIIFNGSAHIGMGSKINVNGGVLVLGNNFAISAQTEVNCYYRIVFGSDIQFSWDCLVMDSDTHNIYDECGAKINNDKEIIFGNKIWIGCRVTILKGSRVPSNSVIGASSVVCSDLSEENSIYVGNPPRNIKKIKNWEL